MSNILGTIVAAHFLAGAILTLLIPAGLFAAVLVWYVRIARKRSQ